MSSTRFTCTQENLLRGLARVAPVAGRSSQLPILNHTLLTLGSGGMTLTTTDLEIGVQATVGGKLEGEGRLAVPARSLLAYVQQLPSGHPIVVEQRKNGIRVETKGYSAQFHSVDPEDFPLLPKAQGGGSVQVWGGILASEIQRVSFAAARDETRPEIRGVYMSFSGDGLRVAATDGFRLAESVVSEGFDEEFSCVLPLGAAQEVVRLFNGVESEVTVTPQDSFITFQTDDVHFSSRLIDGSYPDYKQIIPKESKNIVLVPRDELVQACKILMVFLPRDSRRVEVVIEPKDGRLVVQVVGDGLGEGVAEVPIEGEGQPVRFLVNIHYLLEGIQHITGDVCRVGVSDEVSPVVITPKKSSGYTYVVMPIKQ